MSASDPQVGDLLRLYRNAKGLSARQLSLSAGLSESVVGKVETSSIEPSVRVFAAIVCELGLTDREIAFLVRRARYGATRTPISSA